MERILVWDLPTRLGHWLLAAAFAVAWITGESEEWRLVHAMAGGVVVAVLVFRVIWGFAGTTYARFAQFVRSPGAAWEYLRSLLHRTPPHFTGHNPAGAIAIVVLIGLGLATGVAGWLNYQEIGGEWLEELHEVLANTMLLVVLVHLAGVAVGSVMHRENLPRAMVTGLKLGERAEAITQSRPLVAAFLLAWAIALGWLLSR